MSATRESAPGVASARPRPRTTRARVLPVVVAVVAAYLVFVGARLAVFDGDPSGFVSAGDGVTSAEEAPANLSVTEDVDGYDGQAYYRLARDPLTDEVTAFGITFTRPAYWQTRIGYPLTVWVTSAGGRAGLVPLAMLGANLLALAAIVLLAARLARDLGRNPWWAVIPGLWAGYLVGLGQDLTEPLAGALLLGALVAIRADRPGIATLTLTCAALTRETSLVVAVAVLGTALLHRYAAPDEPRAQLRLPWWIGAVPIAVYAGWRLWVRARWADAGDREGPGDNILREPFGALLGYLGRAMDAPGPEWANLVLLAPTLVALGLVVTAVLRRGALTHERLALAGYLMVLACLPVWDRGQAYLRWGCEPVLLAWLILIGHRPVVRSVPAAAARADLQPDETIGRRTLSALAVVTVLVWVLTATQSVGYPRTDGPWNGLWTWS